MGFGQSQLSSIREGTGSSVVTQLAPRQFSSETPVTLLAGDNLSPPLAVNPSDNPKFSIALLKKASLNLR